MSVSFVTGNVFEYRFGYNFGQVFHDYSGNDNHAVNGESSLTTLYDTIPTDRGAHFPSGDSRIKLPPNDRNTNELLLPASFTLISWTLLTSTSPYFFYRYLDATHFLYIRRDSATNYLIFRAVQGTMDTGERIGNEVYLTQYWGFIMLVLNGNTITLDVDFFTSLTYTLTSSYLETSGNFFFWFGYPFSGDSFQGYLWSLILASGSVNKNDYYGSVGATSCLIYTPCNIPCNPAIVENGVTGCVSRETNPLVNSNGDICNCGAVGCIGSVCLSCSCTNLSCEVIGAISDCWCPAGSSSSSNSCTCTTGSFNGDSCTTVICNAECSACTTTDVCTACTATFADPGTSLCKCKNGYYGTSPLNNANSCIACNNACTTCTDSNTCIICKADHAHTDTTLCTCDYGYYSTGPLETINACIKCNDECSICTSANVCSACTATFADPDTSLCKCKDGYYGTSPLITANSCLACNNACATCADSNTCIICKADHAHTDTILCICDNGYFSTGPLDTISACITCNNVCSTCSDSTSCDSCISLNAIPDGNTCKCIDGYYGTSLLNTLNSCIACNDSCNTCTDSITCIICKADHAHIDTTLCTCDTGYYSIGPLDTINACLNCNEECSICNDSSPCGSCIALNAIPDGNSCICIDGYYGISPLSTTDACKICPIECLTCINSNTCLVCKAENAHPDTTLCKCNDEFYGISPLSSITSCMQCNTDCALCDSTGLCTKCKIDLAVPQNNICSCPTGYFLNTNECTKCSMACLICFDEISCSSCKETYFLNSTEFCSCPENSEEFDGICKCHDGYYLDLNISSLIYTCMPCYSPCKTCDSVDVCTNCEGLLKLGTDKKCSICPEGYYFENSACNACPELCLQCEDLISCQKCAENANGFPCKCDQGYSLQSSNCSLHYFHATIEVLPNNTVYLEFTEPLQTALLTSILEITTEIPSFSISLYEKSLSSYIIVFTFSSSVSKNTEFQINFFTILTSENFSQYDNATLIGFFSQYNLFTNLESIGNLTSTATKAVISAGIISGILSTPSVLWTMLNTIQFFTYLPLNSLKIPEKLKRFFTSMSGLNIAPNFMEYIISNDMTDEPYLEARRFGLNSSSFLLNGGQIFMGFFGGIFLIPLILIGKKLTKGKISIMCEEILANYRYGFFLRFWIQGYLEISIFSFVQLKTNSTDSWLGLLSTCFAVITFFCVIFTPGFIFLSSYFSKENVSSEDNPDFYNKWGSLFTEFKKNRGFFSSQYYFLVFLRRLEYALSQVYLNSFLILQTSLNLCFSIIQLGFLIVYKPFKDPTAMISAFLGEISITATLGLSCGFLVNTNESILSAIEASIFVIVISTIAGQLLISIFLLIKSLKNFWKKVVQKSMKVFLKNADAPTPILFSVETIDSPGKNKNYRKVMPIRS